MLTWTCDQITLSLRHTWAISRESSNEKVNLIVKVSNGRYTGKGEAAPNNRYNETADKLAEQFHSLALADIKTAHDLAGLLKDKGIANALRFAINAAYTHLVCQEKGMTIPQYFGLPENNIVPTMYTVPMMAVEKLGPFIRDNQLNRFAQLKIKVGRNDAIDTLREVNRHYSKELLVDANEAWEDPDEVIRLMENTKSLPIVLFEQPFPAGSTDAYTYLKARALRDVFADESVTDTLDITRVAEQFHGVNMKLMKAGSYENGIHILKQAKATGLKTMIGCMVETTLGISCGYHLASLADYIDLDSFMYLKNDPFALLSEQNGLLTFN